MEIGEWKMDASRRPEKGLLSMTGGGVIVELRGNLKLEIGGVTTKGHDGLTRRTTKGIGTTVGTLGHNRGCIGY